MANTTAYFVATIGLAVSVAAFYVGKSQSNVIIVPGQQTIYVRDQYELDKEEKEAKRQALLNQKRLAKERSALMTNASLIGSTIVQYASAHLDHMTGTLPTQQEIDSGCLNGYPLGGKLACLYIQQKRLQMAGGDTRQYVYWDQPKWQRVAYVFGAGGKVVIFGDGHTWWEEG